MAEAWLKHNLECAHCAFTPHAACEALGLTLPCGAGRVLDTAQWAPPHRAPGRGRRGGAPHGGGAGTWAPRGGKACGWVSGQLPCGPASAASRARDRHASSCPNHLQRRSKTLFTNGGRLSPSPRQGVQPPALRRAGQTQLLLCPSPPSSRSFPPPDGSAASIFQIFLEPAAPRAAVARALTEAAEVKAPSSLGR